MATRKPFALIAGKVKQWVTGDKLDVAILPTGQTDATVPTNSDIRAYYGSKFNPGVLPTFEMDFENARFSLYDAGDSGVYSTSRHFDEFAAWFGTDMQITRASTQTYFDALGNMREAPEHTVRCDHDPRTGKKLGPYIGESRTNLCKYSADHTQWSVAAVTLDDATWTAPDGTAARIWTASSVAATHRLSRSVNAATVGTSLATYSWFVYIPPGSDVQRLYLRARSTADGNSSGQLATLSVTGSGASAAIAFSSSSPFGTNSPSPVTASDVTIQALGGGVFRLGVTGAVNSNASASLVSMDIGFTAATTESAAGTANTRIGVWGWQCEVGGSTSPYIPVPGDASVVRAATTITIGGTKFAGFYSKPEGVIEVSARLPARPTGTRRLVSANDGSFDNRNGIYASGLSVTVINTTAGVTQADLTAGTAVADTLFLVANSYKANAFLVSMNGGSVVSDTSGNPATTVDRLQIGNLNGSGQPDAYIGRVAYYPRADSAANILERSKL